MLKLLGRATSANVQKVAWALAEMDVAFERIDIGGPFGGNREAGYLELNPNGVVPTLIDDDCVTWESNTILRYLANRFGWEALYPGANEPAARSQIERWMDWQLFSLNPGITPLFQSLVRTPPEQRQPELIEQHRQRTRDALRVLDGALAQGSAAGAFLCGANLTLADIAIGPQAHPLVRAADRARRAARARTLVRADARPSGVRAARDDRTVVTGVYRVAAHMRRRKVLDRPARPICTRAVSHCGSGRSDGKRLTHSIAFQSAAAVPSTAVDWLDNVPPLPCASAVTAP